MAISYFKSSQVHVFPCAYRGTDATSAIDPEARLNTEKNLTNTGNNLKGTYLISKTTSGTVTKVNIVIGGYYFELTMDTAVSGNITWASLQDKYLAIKTIETPIVTSGANTTLLVAWGITQAGYLDNSDGNFLGLAICETDAEAAGAAAKIKIADSNGNILNDAYLPDISSSTGSKSLASNGCTATGDHAVSLGLGLTGATNPVDGQTIVGKYNADANGKLFVIGKGDSTTRSNAFTVGTDGSTNVIGTLGVTGNTTVGGTLTTTGNTTLTSAILSSTLEVTGISTFTGAATFNGGATISGDANVTGDIQCTNLEAVREVKCDSLDVGQIGGTSDITLCKTLLPQDNTLSLGNSSHYFNTAYVNQISAEGQLKLKGTSIVLDTINNVGTIYTPKNLYIGDDHGATFSNNGNIHATRNISADGTITAEGKIHANDDIIIASGKHLNLSGTNTGDIRLTAQTASSSTSYTITENGIYSIIVTPTNSNESFTTTMTLISGTGTCIWSPILIHSTLNVPHRIKATKSGTNWNIKFMANETEQQANWTVVKIASLQ